MSTYFILAVLSIVNGALAAVWQEGKKKRFNLLREFGFMLRGG
jgi:hypothetical protein